MTTGEDACTPNAILPVGTQVVTRRELRTGDGRTPRPCGAVAVIVRAPSDHTHSYRVRFPDGAETALRRSEFSVLKHVQRGEVLEPHATGARPRDVLDEFALFEHVVYRCVIGSRAYGLDVEDSDHDRRGVYLPPAEMHWSLYGVPEQLENHERQECYWELQKFLTLALKANPNILECLYTPLVEYTTPLIDELLAMRSIFLSRLIYQTYNGYVMSQFKKLEAGLRNRGAVKWKHAMHLIRLLLSGVTALREGHVPVRVDEHRERLLEIRGGETPWEKVNQWRLALHAEFDAAFETTNLPERPDYERANALLVQARRSRA